MATKQESSTPSLLNLLKEGLLLPTHNPRLFAAVFSTIVASTSLFLLGNHLDIKTLKSSRQEHRQLLHGIEADPRELMLDGTACAYLLFAVIIGSSTLIIVLFAAVGAYSGELHTFRSLLGRVRTHLKGPPLTLAFVYALVTVFIALPAAMAEPLLFAFPDYALGLDTVDLFIAVYVWMLLLCAAFLLVTYMLALCCVSVVVAVAEPGCHGAGSVWRAWRLMEGKRRRAMNLVYVIGVLVAVVSAVHTLATKCDLISSTPSWLLLEFVYSILIATVVLFGVCSVTAFYYECKGRTEASAMEDIMVSTNKKTN